MRMSQLPAFCAEHTVDDPVLDAACSACAVGLPTEINNKEQTDENLYDQLLQSHASCNNTIMFAPPSGHESTLEEHLAESMGDGVRYLYGSMQPLKCHQSNSL